MKRLALLAYVILAPTAQAQAPTAILRHPFDAETHGWIGMGVNCRAAVASGVSFNGAGALRFDYDIKRGSVGMLTFLPKEGSLAGAAAFRFWVRVDRPTTLSLMVQEKGGGRFTSMFVPPKGKWQKVEVALTDLILNEGTLDPRDADGRLDAGSIESVVIGDLAQLIAQAGSDDLEKLVGVQPGPRSLLLDDFTVTGETLPSSVPSSGGSVRLDSFVRPQVAWMATGTADLARVDVGTPPVPALRASYERAAGRILGLIRMFPKGTLKGMDRIAFTAAAQQPTMLLVQVEEAGGGKFNTMCTLAEAQTDKEFTLELAGLSPGDDSPVKDRAVKPELISQVVFIDASGLSGSGPDGPNVLTIRHLAARSGAAR
jgi:hypothetical protein